MPDEFEAVEENKVEPSLKIPTEIYSRVCGYFRPTNSWHKGKQQEFADRKTFNVKKSLKNEAVK